MHVDRDWMTRQEGNQHARYTMLPHTAARRSERANAGTGVMQMRQDVAVGGEARINI